MFTNTTQSQCARAKPQDTQALSATVSPCRTLECQAHRRKDVPEEQKASMFPVPPHHAAHTPGCDSLPWRGDPADPSFIKSHSRHLLST